MALDDWALAALTVALWGETNQAEMRECSAPGGAREAPGALECHRQGLSSQSAAVDQVADGAADDK